MFLSPFWETFIKYFNTRKEELHLPLAFADAFGQMVMEYVVFWCSREWHISHSVHWLKTNQRRTQRALSRLYLTKVRNNHNIRHENWQRIASIINVASKFLPAEISVAAVTGPWRHRPLRWRWARLEGNPVDGRERSSAVRPGISNNITVRLSLSQVGSHLFASAARFALESPLRALWHLPF